MTKNRGVYAHPKRSNAKRRLNKSVHDHVKIQMEAGFNAIHSPKKSTSEQCHLNAI